MALVTVPQEDGTIRIAVGGAKPKAFKVENHTVEVEDADLTTFLRHVDESRLAPEQPKEGRPAKPAGSSAKDGD